MKIPSLLLLCSGLSLALSLSAYAKIERLVEKTFPVSAGGLLRVETSGGSISVQPTSDAVAKVTARQKIRADSEAEADEILNHLTLTIEAQGSDVTAVAKYEKSESLRWRNPPVEVDFIVTVPTRFSANLKTSGGNIVVGDLDGKLSARTSGGDVRLGRISGEIDGSTSGGDIELVEGRGETHLNTSGGNIALGHVAGPTVASTSGGDIKATLVENTFTAKTSGGNITATFGGGLRGDSMLSTSGGRVKANIERNAGFQLDASTSGGDVKAEGLTITIEKGGVGKSRLSGAVNGGGPLLKLRSSGGDIVIGRP